MAFMNNESREKEDRQKIIIEFIRSNPYCNVEAVVQGVENYVSRATVFKLLHQLIENGAVKRYLENNQKRNARDHKLFVDEGNPLISVRLELEEFEKAYFDLFNRASDVEVERRLAAVGDVLRSSEVDSTTSETLKEISHKIDRQRRQKFEQAFTEGMYKAYKLGVWHGRLVRYMLDVFYTMVDACLFRFLYIWSQKISDQQVLQQLYSMVFSKIAGMQTRLSEILKDWEPDAHKHIEEFIQERFRESEGSKPVLIYLELFKKLGMEKEIEPVIDALWKIFGDLQPYVYPEPRNQGWPFKYGEDDWRKLVNLLRQHRKSIRHSKDRAGSSAAA
jgi:hypothetical protein